MLSSHRPLRRNASLEFYEETPAWYLSVLPEKGENTADGGRRDVLMKAYRERLRDIKIPSSVREVTYGVKVTKRLIYHDDLIFLSLPDCDFKRLLMPPPVASASSLRYFVVQ